MREHVTRLRTANDVGVAAHELGHALQGELYISGSEFWELAAGVPDEAKAELLGLGKAIYRDEVPAGGHHSEGLEFIRLALTDDEQARAKAPEFSRWWDAELEKRPQLKRAFESARVAAQQWYRQGSLSRGLSTIVEHKRGPIRGGQARGVATAQALH